MGSESADDAFASLFARMARPLRETGQRGKAGREDRENWGHPALPRPLSFVQTLAKQESRDHPTEEKTATKCDKPNKVTSGGPVPAQPRSRTSPAPPPPGGTNPNPRSQACQCLSGRGLCAASNRSLGASSLELSLHPCAVLGGGVDGGPATRAGLLLPGLLVIGLWRLKVHGLSRWELLEGRGPW